jgi:hypothetical protein
LIVLCGNLTIPYCGRFFHCFYLEERKNCATALAGHRAAILFNRKLKRKKEVKCVEYVREIFAQYDRQCIRVYQAYNPIIAKEAISLQTFGENFDVNRMTWIKPSFLWLMHRSNWGTKKIRNVF